MNHLVITEWALQACLSRYSPNELRSMRITADAAATLTRIDRADTAFVLHREDEKASPRIVLINYFSDLIASVPDEALSSLLQRVHRASIESRRLPMHLPRDWREYHHDNFVAFFATPLLQGNRRLIMETRPLNSDDCCFWELSSLEDMVWLHTFTPDRRAYVDAVAEWNDAFDSAVAWFAKTPAEPRTELLQRAVDLEAATFGAVTQYKTYTDWLPDLTNKQRQFVEGDATQSTKLRGPAGSGKTLTLAMKLLREFYRSEDNGEHIRILFATHSWAVAEQVDGILHRLDERGIVTKIDVLPLVTLAQYRLPRDRASDFTLLGEDSLSGKQLQLSRIAEVVESIRSGDWLTLQSSVSKEFRNRVEAEKSSPVRAALVWDLMNEFASVLSANGILPGVNAFRKYSAIPRTPWMMPLVTETERRFVLRVYSEYVAAMRTERLLTTDQLINDYLNFLETFVWNLRRRDEGYDLIFVDELHLFSEQERLALQYLSRDPDVYPRMFMALDPRQSAMEVYAGYRDSRPTARESGEADRSLGEVRAVVLDQVHRFSPEVLAFLRHLNDQYPALDLGEEWELDLGSVSSAAPSGARPELHVHQTSANEISAVIAQAEAMHGGIGRIAVLTLDPIQLPALQVAAESRGIRFCLVAGRDDVAELRFQRKSIVLSAAEFVPGLQFARVIVCGISDPKTTVTNIGYRLRRFLSLFYLAVSRSEGAVHIHVNDEHGGVPEVIAGAIAAGLIGGGTQAQSQ